MHLITDSIHGHNSHMNVSAVPASYINTDGDRGPFSPVAIVPLRFPLRVIVTSAFPSLPKSTPTVTRDPATMLLRIWPDLRSYWPSPFPRTPPSLAYLRTASP